MELSKRAEKKALMVNPTAKLPPKRKLHFEYQVRVAQPRSLSKHTYRKEANTSDSQ